MENAYHRSEVKGLGCLVVDSDKVDKEGSCTDTGRDQESSNHHLPDPELATRSGVHATAEVAIDGRRDRVHKNSGVQQRSTPCFFQNLFIVETQPTVENSFVKSFISQSESTFKNYQLIQAPNRYMI